MKILESLKSYFFPPKAKFPFDPIPYDVQLLFLTFLTLKQTLVFSEVSKGAHQLASCPLLWNIFAKNLRLTPPSAFPKKDVEFAQMMYTKLDLKLHLGKEVCLAIEEMPYYDKPIIIDEKTSPQFSQLPFQKKSDRKDHFFKTIFNGDFYLILIKENRSDTSITRISTFFTENPDEKHFFYSHYCANGINHSSTFKSTALETSNALEWAKLKLHLCSNLNIVSVSSTKDDIHLQTGLGIIVELMKDLNNL